MHLIDGHHGRRIVVDGPELHFVHICRPCGWYGVPSYRNGYPPDCPRCREATFLMDEYDVSRLGIQIEGEVTA